MELFWKNHETYEYNDGGGLDLDDVWAEPDVLDAESFKLAVLFHIALWAVEKGYSMDRIVGFTLDNDGDEVEITSEAGDWTWLDNICHLVEHLQTKNWLEANMFLACVKNEGWSSFDWGNLSNVEDTFSQEWDGDYEGFAREYMENVGEDLPEHISHHFDYRQYGEDLVDEYDMIEFAGTEYLFHQ